ncbi:VOC family protein [Anaerorhabdus sp.]|uniref:VOC family protein n=1 Tax=Anaerorhabdus sp. TaxID=1872524 RepID=UPI002FCB38A5
MNKIKKIDHFVITTANADKCFCFYDLLGFKVVKLGSHGELYAGDFKINVHYKGFELFPHAKNIKVGSADLCFEISGNIDDFKDELECKGIEIEEGVVNRSGVNGSMRSIYLRDPDGNLIEFSSYNK